MTQDQKDYQELLDALIRFVKMEPETAARLLANRVSSFHVHLVIHECRDEGGVSRSEWSITESASQYGPASRSSGLESTSVVSGPPSYQHRSKQE